MSCEILMLNKRQIFQSAIEGKLRVQDTASERLQDQIIEEIKELESTKTEEALQIAEKSIYDQPVPEVFQQTLQWRQVVEKKAYRGRMWNMMGKEPYLRGM